MKNNQANSNNLVHQYNITVNPTNNPINIPTPSVQPFGIKKVEHEPALERAKKALKLVNPFKGV